MCWKWINCHLYVPIHDVSSTYLRNFANLRTGTPDNLFDIWRICMGILRASYLKQNFGGNVDIFLQNKRKLTSVVVVCRPYSRKLQILVIIGDFEGSPPNPRPTNSPIFTKICHLRLQGRQTTTIEVSLRLLWRKVSTLPPIFCFKYEARNIPIQILQISNTLSACPVVYEQSLFPLRP